MRDSLALLMSPPCSPAHAAERRLHPEKQIHISKATVVFALCPCNMAIGSLQVTSNTFSNEKSLKKTKQTQNLNPKASVLPAVNFIFSVAQKGGF